MPGGVERDVMLSRIGTFMHWKQAKAFIMAVETVLPNGVYACLLYTSPSPRDS